jgi:branched-chain amino acid transport system ATP-binding protein
VLTVESIDVYYGASHILQGVSLQVQPGETVALLGRNGAGKTTTFRSIAGLNRARKGSVRFDGVDITTLRADQVARRGLAFVPSGRRLFGSLTVKENLVLAAGSRSGDKIGGWTVEGMLERFPALDRLAGRQSSVLSGGEQQLLKLARALLQNPKLLLLDEPSEGLAPVVISQVAKELRELQRSGLTILVSEQQAAFALALASRAYILENGRIVEQGDVEELRAGPALREYLGV